MITSEFDGKIRRLLDRIECDAVSPADHAELSSHVSARLSREQQAWAEIGLDPNRAPFTSCLQGLRDLQSADFMAEGHRN